MVEQKCKITLSGRSPQERGMRITPTTLQSNVIPDVNDYG
jgi:hypothetical protein